MDGLIGNAGQIDPAQYRIRNTVGSLEMASKFMLPTSWCGTRTAEDAKITFPFMKAMSTPWVEPEDISHAVVYLASDESRFVTGQQLRVDAGAGVKLGI